MSSHEAKIVAVIDDNPATRCALIRLLATLGYDAQSFDSAEAFLVATQTSKAACLLLDIQLGDISGIELARQLADEGINVPIIFMTGLDDDKVRRQAEAVPACVAFLNKPFTEAALTDAIVRATGWRVTSPPTGSGV